MIRASPICCVASACHYERAEKSIQNLVILSQAAAAYALAGRKDMARAMISGMEGQARERYVCGFNAASLYSVVGDKPLLGLKRRISAVRIECPLSGWIPGSIRCQATLRGPPAPHWP
jgi:hypothetical protein